MDSDMEASRSKSGTAIIIHLGDSCMKVGYSATASSHSILCHVDMKSWCATTVGFTSLGTVHAGSAEDLMKLSPESVVPALLSLAAVTEKDVAEYCAARKSPLQPDDNNKFIKVKFCDSSETKVVSPLELLCALFSHASQSVILYYKEYTTFRDHAFDCVVVISGDCSQAQFDLVRTAIDKTKGLKLKTILPESISACLCFWRKDTSLYLRIGYNKVDVAVVTHVPRPPTGTEDYRVQSHVALHQFGLITIAESILKEIRPEVNISAVSALVKNRIIDSLARLSNEQMTIVTDDAGTGHLISANRFNQCVHSFRASIYSAVSKALDLAGVQEEKLVSVVSAGRLGASPAVVALLKHLCPNAKIHTRPTNNSEVELKGGHRYLRETSIDFLPTKEYNFHFKPENLFVLSHTQFDNAQRAEVMKRLDTMNRNIRGTKNKQRS